MKKTIVTGTPVLLQCLAAVHYLLIVIPAPGQDHPCTGVTDEHVYKGGDKDPITWSSLRHDEGNAIYAYEPAVQNYYKDKISEVFWPVAGFYRKYLMPGRALCCRSEIPGSSEAKDGPLTWGSGSSEPYPTTAYKPIAGWKSFTSYGERQIPLVAQLEITVPVNDRFNICVLSLKSVVIPDSDADHRFKYVYEFINSGDEPLDVFCDIPRSEEFDRQFKIDERKPLLVEPGNKIISRAITSSQKPGWGASSVSVYGGERNELLARNIVGVYGFAEGKTTSSFDR
jgi:hypothetical protein